MTPDYEKLSWEINNSILTLTLNRPEHLNAFTLQMCDELIDAFQRADKDDEVRAIIVTGSGRAFCAGMDLKLAGHTFGLDHSIDIDGPNIAKIRDAGGRLTLQIFTSLKPVIAAINGPAVGIGASMTLPMDMRIASKNARFGFVFSRIGIVPDACSSWFLPRIVGIAQALEWTYSGDIIAASDALKGSLVSAVIEPDDLLEESRRCAHKFIDSTSSVSIALIRQMMWRMLGEAHPMAAHKAESRGMFHTSQADGQEGVAAFLKKRSADFTHKVSQDLPDIFPSYKVPPFE